MSDIGASGVVDDHVDGVVDACVLTMCCSAWIVVDAWGSVGFCMWASMCAMRHWGSIMN